MTYLRAAARVLALLGTCLVCLIGHGLSRGLGRPSPWPRIFLRRVARICGAMVQTHGRPLPRDVLFVSNHLSWLDIPIIAGATGTAFVAKADLRDWPVIGWLSSINHTVFVDRGNRLGVHGQVGAVRDALAHHQPVAIFPEGTTSDGVVLLPFKPSLLEVVAPPPRDIRVQPLFLDYGDGRDLAWVDDEPIGANALRVLGRPGHFVVRLHCLEPFDPTATGDRKAIAAEARRRILAASARGSGRV
jgi:1-acyl-sn-glycerol-3-phosphate acyltransferase